MENNIWLNLSIEKQNEILEKYLSYKEKIIECQKGRNHARHRELFGRVHELEEIFGKDNLNPIIIKNYDDVIKYKKLKNINYELNLNNICEDKIAKRVEAFLKISEIIELGYGGAVDDTDIQEGCVWIIEPYYNFNRNFGDTKFNYKIVAKPSTIDILAFRTESQAKDFYQNNKDLIDSFYMIN